MTTREQIEQKLQGAIHDDITQEELHGLGIEWMDAYGYNKQSWRVWQDYLTHCLQIAEKNK